MFWLRGRILDTLEYRTEKDLRDTIYKNDNFKKQRWSIIERAIIWGSKHLLTANFILISFVIIFTALVSSTYETLKNKLPDSLTGLSALREFHEQIFNAQVMIVGLIFPLVIALIGILIQSRSSNKAIWLVYKHYSGFMLVGFSALSLVLSFVLMKFIAPWLTHQQLNSLEISLSLWFVLNLALSGWFLSKTINFLINSIRMNMVVRYAINDVLVSDIRKRLRHQIAHHAVSLGLIKSYSANLELLMYPFVEYEHKVTAYRAQPQFIKNINFRLLRWGIFLFNNTYKKELSRRQEKATLCFPYDVDSYQAKEVRLVETDLGRFDYTSSLLIRYSFQFSSKVAAESLELQEVVAALFGQVEDALKENNSALFLTAKEDLEIFQREIESCLFFINDNDEPDNWMLLHDSSVFGRDYLHIFIRESITISKAVTNRIPEDKSYYSDWCYFFPRVYSRLDQERPSQIGIRYLDGHYSLWEKLMAWMGGYNVANSSFNQTQDSVIKLFVGSWEHWQYLLKIMDDGEDQIDSELLLQHLMNTSRMVVTAMKFNNWEASEWAVDMLNNWREVFARIDGYENIQWHTELLTNPVLNLDPNSRLYKVAFGNTSPNIGEAQAIVLGNYSIDIRFLTASYILGSRQFSGSVQTRLNHLVRMIIRAERIDNSGSYLGSDGSINTPSDLMGVFLRQHLRINEGQSSWYESHLERLSSVEEPDWVSGRIYSTRGENKEFYVPVFFKVIGIALTDKKFKLSHQWAELFLVSEALNQKQFEAIIRELKKLTVVDEKIITKVCAFSEIDETKAREKSELFKSSVEEIINELESKAIQEIENAEIDYNRLEWMGRVTSTTAFDNENGIMPLALYQNINFSETHQVQPYVVNINEYQKSEVAANIETNRAANEESWLKHIVNNYVRVQLFRQMFSAFSWTERTAGDGLSLFKRVIEDSEAIKLLGQTPVLFVGQHEISRLINYSRFEYIPENERLPYEIHTESDQPDSYVAHIEGIEVHRFQTNDNKISVMVPRESFKTLIVREYGEQRYVNFDYVPSQTDILTGTLKVEFEIDSEFESASGYKYYLSDGEKT